MTSQTRLQLPQRYKHQLQDRSERQIQLTNNLAIILSQLNLKRIKLKQQEKYSSLSNNTSKFYFVCLCGIPPFDNQYQNLDLPGQKTVISLDGLLGDYSQSQYLQFYKKGGFENQAAKVRKVVEQKSKLHKIVVVYHSFGTFTFMNYLRLFPDHKVSGIIDVGGGPIRFYPLLINLIKDVQGADPQVILENKDHIHEAYINSPSMKNAGFIPFRNRYQTIIFLKLPISKSFQTMFDYMQNLPKVLKLFIYGSKDRIFPEKFINQKAIYYSYLNKFNPQYQQKLKKSYSNFYQTSCNNVQERFIFRLEGGQHSIHMQNKFNNDLKIAIKQYIEVLSGVVQ